jgi:hypothetical protein
MKKLTNLFATCLLVLSLSAFAFAGETQGPSSPQPPPPGETQGPSIVVQSPSENLADASIDALRAATELVARWFLNIL